MVPRNRRREHHTKVKTGCFTCKRRHVKCDESKPECKRCLGQGYKCDGYWSLEPIRVAKENPLGSPFTNSEELQAFQYFMEVTIKWFEVKDDPCFEECKAYQYWNPMTIQVMHSEPAIKHLLVALASVHRYVREDKDINNEIVFLNAYTTALRELATNTPDVSIVLMACMMMCILEVFRGQKRTFYHHLNSGLRVLKQFDENAEPKNTPCNERIRVFLRPTLYNSKLNAVAMTDYGLLDPKVPPGVRLQEMKTRNKIPIASQPKIC